MRHAVRLTLREVIFLAQVIAQVVKLKAHHFACGNSKPADELPVARADPNAAGSFGTLAMRKIIEKRLTLELPRPAQHGGVALSVDLLLLRLRNANEVEQRRIQ